MNLKPHNSIIFLQGIQSIPYSSGTIRLINKSKKNLTGFLCSLEGFVKMEISVNSVPVRFFRNVPFLAAVIIHHLRYQ